MALRSRSRATAPTSGPGRPPASDGRFRHRRPPRAHAHAYVHDRTGARHHGRRPSAEELRRRAQALFDDRPSRAESRVDRTDTAISDRRHSGKAPPPGRQGSVTGGGDGEGRPPTEALAAGPATERRPGSGDEAGPDAVRAGTHAEPSMGTGPAPGAGSRRERLRLAVRERMPLWLQTRCGLERRGVVALTVVLVVAVGLAAQHFWTGRTQSVRAPEVVRAAATPGEDGAAGAGRAVGPGGTSSRAAVTTPGASGTGGAEIVVDVSGKVREPGIHRLPAGSRVADALRAAGGVRPGTDTDALNRARFLVDGEQVIVGPPPAGTPAGTGVGAGGAGGAGASGAAAGAVPAAPVSLNTATVDQLDTLPGVGPVLAGHIVAYRTQHGGFRSVDELREVNGIGERRFADLRDLVRP